MNRTRIALIMSIVIAFGTIGLVIAVTGGFDGDSHHPDSSTTPARTPIGQDMPVDNTLPVSQGLRQAIIEGDVRTADGAPVAGAMVVPQSAIVAVPDILITSNVQGHYRWTLPPGTYAMQVRKEGYAGSAKTVSVKTGETLVLDFVVAQS